MAMSHKELIEALQQLEDKLPQLMKENDEDSFLEIVDRRARQLEDGADLDDMKHIRRRIARMLDSRGLTPPKSARYADDDLGTSQPF
jgi:hypothetical protein